MAKEKVKKEKLKRKVKRASPRRLEKTVVGAARQVRASKRKINLALRNLVLFAIIAIISMVLRSVTSNVLINKFFFLLAIITGFIAVAFLIVLLIFLLLKAIGK